MLSVEFLVFKDSQDSIRHYTMIPKRAENFAKNITTRIRFGEENHLDEFAKNCNITSSGTLPVTIWKRIFCRLRSGLGQVWARFCPDYDQNGSADQSLLWKGIRLEVWGEPVFNSSI